MPKKYRTIRISEDVDYTCPLCGKRVDPENDKYLIVTSGRGKFRKSVYEHKDCYKSLTKGN